MASPILNALSKGFSNLQILAFLRRQFPQHAQQIKQAEMAGYTARQIVRYLENGRHGVNEIPEGQLTEHEKTRKGDKDRQKKLERNLATGAAVLGAAGFAGIASLGGAGIRGATTLLPALPGNPQGGGPAPQIGGPAPQAQIPYISPIQRNAPLNNPPNGQPPIPQPTGNPIQPNAPSPNVPPQPITPTQPNIPEESQAQPTGNPPKERVLTGSDILWDALSKGKTKGADPQTNAFLKVAKQIKATGGLNTKEDFDKFHQIFEEKRGQKLSVPELARELFRDYDANFGPNAQQKPPNIQKSDSNIQQPEGNPLESPQNIENNSLESPKTKFVRLSDGQIAEVKGEKGKVYKVDAAGKERLVPKKHTQPEPKSVSNSQVTFDLSKVPEEDRSAALSFVEMPKNRKDIIIKFGLGESPYRYWRKDGEPIAEFIVSRIKEGITVPVADGDEFMGGWNSNEATSRGTVAAKEFSENAQEFGEETDDPSKLYYYEAMENVFTHGFFKQFYDELGIKKENFDREKAERKLREGKRKRARQEKDIKRRYE